MVLRISEDGEFTTVDAESIFYKKAKGRPSIYDFDDIEKKYEEYISEYTKEKYIKLEKTFSSSSSSNDNEERESEAGSYERKLYVKVPGETSFARYLGIATSTLFDWKEKHKEFKELMDDLMDIQKDFLLNGAISGRLNPLIAKLLLSKHGIFEETKTTLSGSLDLTSFFEEKPKDILTNE